MENLGVTRSFWENQKVFLTGHTGFKGSWLSAMLLQLGAKVHGYSLPPPTKPSMFEVLGLEKKLASTFDTICKADALAKAISASKPSIVFHMAAQPLVLRSYVEPLETYETNVMGTANLLQACRDVSSIESVVIITTDKCYENKEWIWSYRENDRLGGHDPYSNSKACAELVVDSFRKSFFEKGPRIVSARAGNVIGGGDWAENRLVPDLVRASAEKEKIELRNPTFVRPWQHVLEPLTGYLQLAEKATARTAEGAFNFGPEMEDCVSVGKVVDYFKSAWGDGTNIELAKTPQPHEAKLLRLDSTKAKQMLGWQPRWSVAEAVRHSVNWYKAYYDKKAVDKITEQQIAHFIKR